MRAIFALCFALLFAPSFALAFAAGASAQAAGDIAVFTYSAGTSHLLGVSRSGAVTTVLSRASVLRPDDLMVAPGNNGFVFGESASAPRQEHVLRWTPGNAVTTLAVLPTTFSTVPDYAVDQGSDILLLSASGTDRGVFSMPGTGGPLSTVAKLSGRGFLYAMAEEIVSGDIMVFDTSKTLHRIQKSGTVTTVKYSLPPALALAIQGNVHVDHRTGLVYLSYTNYVLSVDPNTGATTSIFQPSTGNRWSFSGIDADPYQGGFLLGADRVQPTPTGKFVLRYDPLTNVQTTVATLPNLPQSELVVTGARMLTGLTRPTRGQSYGIHLSIPPEVGQQYFAAASFGTLAGISIGGGRQVQLDADALFFLSIQVPAIFANFQGTLDNIGVAALSVNIPNTAALLGVRFFIAAVTVDQVGVRVITEPLGVTIE